MRNHGLLLTKTGPFLTILSTPYIPWFIKINRRNSEGQIHPTSKDNIYALRSVRRIESQSTEWRNVSVRRFVSTRTRQTRGRTGFCVRSHPFHVHWSVSWLVIYDDDDDDRPALL
jgi:hypothetical protein